MLLFLGCILLTIPANILLAYLVINENDDEEIRMIGISTAVSLVISLLCSVITYCTLSSGLYAQEYLGSYAVSIHHEEQWNEYIQQTCSSTSTDSQGNSTTTYYDCSYIQNHAEYWSLTSSIGHTFYIDESYYGTLSRMWGGDTKTGHHRGHTISGDIYDCSFNGRDADLVYVNTPHSYYNVTQSRGSLLKFAELSNDEKLDLYSRPDQTFDSPSVLGGPDNHLLKVLNARYGSLHQIRMYILLFEGKGMEVASRQKQYWKGAAKNELVICIGTKSGKVTWCYIFTWSESDNLTVEVRDEVIKQTNQILDLDKVAQYLKAHIPTDWERKHFSDFKYIHPKPSSTAITISLILSFLVSFVPIIFYVGKVCK